MKNKFLIFSIFLFFISFYSCDNPIDYHLVRSSSSPLIRLNWNNENSIVCFGTSITNGKPFSFFDPIIVGGGIHIPAPKADSSYPALLGKKLKIKVINQGHWGMVVSEAYLLLQDSVFSKKPVLVLLEFGANEFLRGYDVSEVEPQLDSLIKRIKNYNVNVVLLSFFNPDMFNYTPPGHFLLEKAELAQEYYNMFIRVAKANNIFIDDYILKDIWGRDEFMSMDGVHPNNKGNAILVENIFNYFYNTFKYNSMIK